MLISQYNLTQHNDLTRFFFDKSKIQTCSSSWIEAVKGSPSATLATIVIKIIFENFSHNDLTRFFLKVLFDTTANLTNQLESASKSSTFVDIIPGILTGLRFLRQFFDVLLSLVILKDGQRVNYCNKDLRFFNLMYFRLK